VAAFWPAAQGVHAPPALENVFSGQSVQFLPGREDWPAGQFKQDDAPLPEYLPAAHVEQLLAIEELEKVPDSQAVQTRSPPIE